MIEAPRSRGNFTTVLALLFFLALAALLRLWGIDYGIPHTVARPDEETVLSTAFTMVGKRELDPRFFEYPSFSLYASALGMEGYYRLGRLRGRYDALRDFLVDAVVLRPGLTYRIGRGVSVAFALLTVVAAFALGWESSRLRTAGLLAALLLAVGFLHVAFSRFATVDVAMTFFTTGALVFAVRSARTRSGWDFFLAGILTGLAASAKYNAGLVGLALVPPALSSARREGFRLGAGKLALAALASFAAFAATSPYALMHWDAVQSGFAKHGTFYTHGPDPLGFWVHLGTTFPLGLGWPLYAAAVSGGILAVRRRRVEDLVLLTFFLTFLLLIGGVRVVYPRYALPLVPVMVVWAAELVTRLVKRPSAIAALALVLALPNVVSSVRFDRLAARRDTRLLAADWVSENVPRRAPILLCRGYGAPEINADRRRPPAFEPRSISCRPESVVESDARYLVTHEHPVLTRYSSLDRELSRWLEAKAAMRARFDPFDRESAATPVFYFSDAFYLPLAGFDAVERGGPVVTVWELPGER